MLVDDNSDDNFYHERVIKKNDLADSVIAMTDAMEALNYLRKENPLDPELIFLDINMPGMNGWDFLQEYKQLKKSGTIIIMLTTSENQDDKSKALATGIVSDFRTKPLSKEMLEDILSKHY